ncbi:MAG: hypothetical protein KF856_13460 [Cyclobacteriaceae bacterium]|nr:hypothetical protein [Cyclobacteriaceae bacterium]
MGSYAGLYRYGYQGEYADKDEETGWNHFELREYDGVIGRWLVRDPFREFWSPYLAFGNDPVNIVDPRGGFTDPKPGDLNDAGTQQWGFNGVTNQYEWTDILGEIVIKPVSLAYRGAEIAQFSLDRAGWYVRGTQRPTNYNPIKNVTLFDCSGWVAYAVGKYHPELRESLGGSTDTYEASLGKARKTDPKVGDIALWNGHAEIVYAVHEGGAFSTIGSSSKDGTPVPHNKWKQFKGLSDPQLKRYGRGGSASNGVFLGFITPIVSK